MDDIQTTLGFKKRSKADEYKKGGQVTEKETLTFLGKLQGPDGIKLEVEMKVKGSPDEVAVILGEIQPGQVINVLVQDGGQATMDDFEEEEEEEDDDLESDLKETVEGV